LPTKKVTRRWLYNSFLVILIFLSLLIIAFSIAVRSYYYNSVLTIVRNTASVQNASLVNYSEDNTVDFSSSVRKMVEDFDEKRNGHHHLQRIFTHRAAGYAGLHPSAFQSKQRFLCL